MRIPLAPLPPSLLPPHSPPPLPTTSTLPEVFWLCPVVPSLIYGLLIDHSARDDGQRPARSVTAHRLTFNNFLNERPVMYSFVVCVQVCVCVSLMSRWKKKGRNVFFPLFAVRKFDPSIDQFINRLFAVLSYASRLFFFPQLVYVKNPRRCRWFNQAWLDSLPTPPAGMNKRSCHILQSFSSTAGISGG